MNMDGSLSSCHSIHSTAVVFLYISSKDGTVHAKSQSITFLSVEGRTTDCHVQRPLIRRDPRTQSPIILLFIALEWPEIDFSKRAGRHLILMTLVFSSRDIFGVSLGRVQAVRAEVLSRLRVI